MAFPTVLVLLRAAGFFGVLAPTAPFVRAAGFGVAGTGESRGDLRVSGGGLQKALTPFPFAWLRSRGRFGEAAADAGVVGVHERVAIFGDETLAGKEEDVVAARARVDKHPARAVAGREEKCLRPGRIEPIDVFHAIRVLRDKRLESREEHLPVSGEERRTDSRQA